MKRSRALDLLRGVAIVLVLLHHQDRILLASHRIGWAGVDLFFVLSGFLVTGLLIRERAEFGNVQVGRFLLRRGLKIYPSFWAMIAASCALSVTLSRPVSSRAVVCELLFLQNYGPGLWVSTWSLAVEEHFYFAIALFFVILNRRRAPLGLKHTVALVVGLLACVLVARVVTQTVVPHALKLRTWGTHVRIDGLIFGALIAYGHHNMASLGAWVRRHRLGLIGASGLLLAPVVALGHDSPFVQSVGFTMTYLASGCVLLLMIYAPEPTHLVARGLAGVGRHSYGIYLWHIPIRDLVLQPLEGAAPPIAWLAHRPESYFALCLAGGVLLSRLIEAPFLRLGDKYVPRRSRDERPSASVGTSAPG